MTMVEKNKRVCAYREERALFLKKREYTALYIFKRSLVPCGRRGCGDAAVGSLVLS